MIELERKSYIDMMNKKLMREKTLIITGARQVGKTTILRQFQKQQTLPCLYINCEEYFSLPFTTLKEFGTRLHIEYGFDITLPGVLLLDEIQTRSDPDRLIKSYHDNTDIKASLIVT